MKGKLVKRKKRVPLNSWWLAVPGDLGWTRGVINHALHLARSPGARERKRKWWVGKS